jgi:hypothetical protein
VTDAVSAVINAKDGLILGKSSVYLEGRRANVRQQETNFGNLSADANLWYAKNIDSTVEVSLKNGGGIRNSIGAVSPLGVPGITAANPTAGTAPGKLAGDVSRLDVEDSLKFNNQLTLFTVTASELKLLLEHAVAGSNGTGAANATAGQFCQLGGIQVVADLAETAVSYTSAGTPPVISAVNGGNRIRYAALINSSGAVTEVLISNGIVLNPARTVRMVTLNFLVNSSPANSDFGGDSYPFPYIGRLSSVENRLDLTTDGSANGYTLATSTLSSPPAEGRGSEQDAFAEYMLAFHASTPFNKADTAVELDRRIIQGTTDSDADGYSNAIEVASLGLDPDVANTSSQINTALAVQQAGRLAGRTDVTSSPAAYSLYTASSIQDLRGTGNLLIQAGGANVTLTLPLEKSTGLNTWGPADEDLEATFPKTQGKEFYRVILPQ